MFFLYKIAENEGRCKQGRDRRKTICIFIHSVTSPDRREKVEGRTRKTGVEEEEDDIFNVNINKNNSSSSSGHTAAVSSLVNNQAAVQSRADLLIPLSV